MKSKIVISTNAPYNILAVGSNIEKVLGFVPRQLQGCTLQSLEGPETDTVLMHRAIKSAFTSNRPICCQLILYDSKGRSKNVIVTCSKYMHESSTDGQCLLTIKNSQAFALGEIEPLLSNHVLWVLTFSEWPFSICTFSSGVSEIFGPDNMELHGSNLASFKAPDCHPSCWLPLTRSAGMGSITAGSASIRLRSGIDQNFSFLGCPVVEWPNSRITHLAVVFESIDEASRQGVAGESPAT